MRDYVVKLSQEKYCKRFPIAFRLNAKMIAIYGRKDSTKFGGSCHVLITFFKKKKYIYIPINLL